MVTSKINPEIQYSDTKHIDYDDNELESSTYDIVFDEINPNKNVTVTFGKVKYTYSGKGILYYPMYLVVGNETKGQIGVMEIPMEALPTIIDEDGDIDPEKVTQPLLYGFVTNEYLSSFDTPTHENDSDADDVDLEIISLDESKNMKETEDIFTVIPKVSLSEIKPKSEPKTIFTNDVNKSLPAMLTEETKKDASELKTAYEESPTSEWIEKFMKNNQYKIIDNEGSGDCLFAVIRDAYAEIGQNTTIPKMRELLASEATDAIFQEYRNVYLSMENELVENQKESDILKKTLKELQKRIKTVNSKDEHNGIILDAKTANERIKTLKRERSNNEEFLKYNFGFMKDIDTLSKFQEYIKTSSYWADAWAISTLEKKLNMKMIIFSEEAFNEDSLDSVLNCGESSNDGAFNPNHYIMTSYSGIHYRLISYKDKKIFTFREIPYDVKMLIMNKCMERNSGIYYLIQDFRNLKSKIGISPDEGKPEDDNDNEQLNYMSDLFDPTIKFMFHWKSQNKIKPGLGSGEIIPNDKKHLFINLSKIDNWRRKIDDSWASIPFTLDNHRWVSVEHYYQASKFKKGNPEFYRLFSLDSESDISKDVGLAKEAGGKNNTQLRDKKIKIDPDFYGERNLAERDIALRAKFEQNLDLKQLLLLTYPAKLVLFERGYPPKTDYSLMKLRKDLLDSNQ